MVTKYLPYAFVQSKIENPFFIFVAKALLHFLSNSHSSYPEFIKARRFLIFFS